MQVAPCVCQLQSAPFEPTLCELPAESVGRDEVGECLLSIDLDDRDQLPITRLELAVAVDSDLLDLEAEFLL